ncbi:MAG: general secretion pathway protein GspK [Rhodospirillales bacterium]|nr:general secretion pathway protein GspK [Rhodospirillales bacterium]
MQCISRRERGFALLMVLWTLMLLAFIATVFGDNARTEVLLARNLVSNARAEALADGGVFRAAAGLTRAPRDGGFRGDGQIYVWRPALDDNAGGEAIDGEEVRFTIRDEGGKIDLNQASAGLLRELFVAIGLEPKPSAALADAIVDFRDEDQEKQAAGAETREYKAAELPWGPKNKPFVLVEELIYVLGMSPEIYRRVAPLVTVRGQGETPHPYTAPPEVLEAMTAALKAPRGRPSAGKSGASGSQSKAQSDEPRGASTGSALGLSRSSDSSGSTPSGRSAFGSSGLGSGGGSSLGTGLSQFGGQSSFSDGAEETETDLEQQERSGGTAFTVHAEGRTADGTVFTREATIDLTGTETAPVAIRSWRLGERTLFPMSAGAPG